jgi:hypothetical protein
MSEAATSIKADLREIAEEVRFKKKKSFGETSPEAHIRAADSA